MSDEGLRILIIDDESNIRKTLALYCETQGHQCTTASNIMDGISATEHCLFDLAFIDIRIGTDNGLDYIPRLISANPWLKIVVISAYATIDAAVKAMQIGAIDFLPKPFVTEQIHMLLKRTATMKKMEQSIQSLQEDIDRMQPEIFFNSQSPSMQRLYDLARQVADSEATVLIEGPSGSGKTVLAKKIHEWSSRSEKRFGVVSCPSLSHDLLESELFGHKRGSFTGALQDNQGKVAFCEGGTLFLDEIGDLPLTLQPKLLRFIQEREYERVGDHLTRKANLRLITATNTDLEQSVREGTFREDLFFRLSVIVIKLPALRERKEDIVAISEALLSFFCVQNHRTISGFDPYVLNVFQDYTWPGNLRELRNVIERMVILCRSSVIGADLVPEHMLDFHADIRIGDPITLLSLERAHIQKILIQSKTLQEAAETLGIDQATLWRKRKQFNLD